MTGSTGPLYSAVQGVNSDGNSLWLNSAVQTALSYVSDSDTNMYRIIVLTNGDVSYGYELSSYDYTNVSLNIVSLGRGSIGSDLENIVYDTYGDVYYGYPSSALTNVTGNTIDIPPQFIGEDSDGDTIPDIVELYGLKPNGQPINSDPNKKDTDGDGLDDNVEIHYNGSNWTSEVNKNEYDGTVYCGSDPTLIDTDWDTYDDKKEYELGSNPSVANFYIENEDYEFVMNNDYYNSDAYRTMYNNSVLTQMYVGLGNYVFNSNYSKVELYKTAIVDYLNRTLESKKSIYETQEWIDLAKSICDGYNDSVGLAYKVLETSGKPIDITQRDMELIKEFQAKMKENLKIINSYNPFNQSSEEVVGLVKQANLDFEYLSSQVDSVSKKINLKNMSIKFLDNSVYYLGGVIDIANWGIVAIDTYCNYINFKSSVQEMEDGIKILEIFTQSDDIYVKKAALELLDYANIEYENAYYEWLQAAQSFEEDLIGAEVFAIINKLPKYGSYASLFVVVSDWATNIGETATQAEYTFANATVAESLRKEIWEMAKTGEQLQNGISISRDYKTAARRFVNLIVLRINAEEQYIAYSKAFPWYSEWLDKDNQEHAQGNINKLNDILEKFT